MSHNISHIFYINLDKRLDRRAEIESELSKYGLEAERFPAIYFPQEGCVGCGKSHLQVLELAKSRKYPNVLILEDDFYFVESKDVVENELSKLFEFKPNFDVCFLSYNLRNGHVDNNNPFLTRTKYSMSASGYLVNEHYYDKLIDLYKDSIPKLEATKKHWIYANDQIWQNLQEVDEWYCFTKRLGKQRDGFSDNANAYVSYNC